MGDVDSATVHAYVLLGFGFVMGLVAFPALWFMGRWVREFRDWVRARRARRRVRRMQRDAAALLLAMGQARGSRRAAASGSIDDFLEGERARPFNPNPGPRDW